MLSNVLGPIHQVMTFRPWRRSHINQDVDPILLQALGLLSEGVVLVGEWRFAVGMFGDVNLGNAHIGQNPLQTIKLTRFANSWPSLAMAPHVKPFESFKRNGVQAVLPYRCGGLARNWVGGASNRSRSSMTKPLPRLWRKDSTKKIDGATESEPG